MVKWSGFHAQRPLESDSSSFSQPADGPYILRGGVMDRLRARGGAVARGPIIAAGAIFLRSLRRSGGFHGLDDACHSRYGEETGRYSYLEHLTHSSDRTRSNCTVAQLSLHPQHCSSSSTFSSFCRLVSRGELLAPPPPFGARTRGGVDDNGGGDDDRHKLRRRMARALQLKIERDTPLKRRPAPPTPHTDSSEAARPAQRYARAMTATAQSSPASGRCAGRRPCRANQSPRDHRLRPRVAQRQFVLQVRAGRVGARSPATALHPVDTDSIAFAWRWIDGYRSTA